MRLGEAFAPLSERPFRLLWLGRASSAAGDALMPLAVAFAVLSVNGSATALGAVLAAFWLSRVASTLCGASAPSGPTTASAISRTVGFAPEAPT